MKPTFRTPDPRRRIPYKVRVYGEIGEIWLEGINSKDITFDREFTTLHVTVDQTALRGILGRLWDLNLTLHSITSEDTGAEPKTRWQNG